MEEIKVSPKPKSDLFFIHGEYVRIDKDTDAYVGFLKNLETNETVMKVVENPMVNIWITKPEYRVYTAKKEWSPKTELEEYSTRYLYRAETIWNALNSDPSRPRWRTMNYIPLRQQMSSPFVYGADIDFGVRMKYRYQQLNGKRKALNYKVGHLDIETDVNGTNQIILITYVNYDGNTYTGILKEFYQNHTIEEIEHMWKKKVEPEFHAALNKKGKSVYEKSEPINLHLKILDGEVELIKWIFDNIHNCRPDFCTIWNIGYDIPYILKRLEFRQVDPCDILCSPDIPRNLRVCTWHEDRSGEHITDNWSWLHLTDYTRYIDAMCCYGRIRKAKPRESSYQLGFIGGKEVGTGKMEFNENSDHHIMQREHKVEYSVYNIVDVVLLRVLELKNNDIRTMMMLIGDSMLEDFSKQSVQLKNSFFVYLDPLGGVPGSVGERLDSPWDKYISNKGGQVLSPDLTKGTGVSILIESDEASYVHKLVCDIDVSSMYPSEMSMLNCTRETRLATILHIIPAKDGKMLKKAVPITIEQIDRIPEVAKALEIYNDETRKKDERKEAMAFMSERIQKFLYQAIYIESNAVPLCSEFLGLPGYEEMDKIIDRQLALESV